MGDDLKDSAIALLGLALFAGFATHRAEHAIVHDLRSTLHGGTLRADVHPHGLLGLTIGRVDSVRVTGSGMSADDVPFRIFRGPGLRANTARLEFDLQDFTLHGTTVRRFTASFPAVSLDAGRAFFDERIILRKAGEGTASAEVAPAALTGFIEKKYPTLKQVEVEMHAGLVTVRGATSVLGAMQQIEATGRLVVRDGRYLDVAEPTVKLNGRLATPAFADNIAKSINPVVDFDKDLGLGRILAAETVEIGEGYAVVRGKAHVPPYDPSEKYEKREKRP